MPKRGPIKDARIYVNGELFGKQIAKKTFKSDFIEKFPNALIDNMCPRNVYGDVNCNGHCLKRDCWDIELT